MRPTASRDVATMFDRISRSYDFLNHFFSLGTDRRWRTSAIRSLHLASGDSILDCGAGTGDMSLTALHHVPDVRCVLLDPAQAMLNIADGKAGPVLPQNYRLVRGIAESLPFADGTFDHFMVAFGVRNFVDLERGLRELHRTMKQGGRGAVLEFTPDRARPINRLFRWYMQHVMEPLGALISHDREAYTYLSRTVEGFSTADQLVELFEVVGFRCAENRRLNLGIARLFVLEKL
jgi:demethylmenaquinone methyltransferase/2-methoxy-6-polyprenyl-1,4-benzoquinol methylase